MSPNMSLIILSVLARRRAATPRRTGPVGIMLTVIVVIQFGFPSSGGANGVPYLPAFWRDLGPFLPPGFAYGLLRDRRKSSRIA